MDVGPFSLEINMSAVLMSLTKNLKLYTLWFYEKEVMHHIY